MKIQQESGPITQIVPFFVFDLNILFMLFTYCFLFPRQFSAQQTVGQVKLLHVKQLLKKMNSSVGGGSSG